MNSPNKVAAILILAHSKNFANKKSGKFRFDHAQLKKIAGRDHVGRKFVKRTVAACREEGFILAEIEPPNYALISVEPMKNYRKITATILNKLTQTEPQIQPENSYDKVEFYDGPDYDPNLEAVLNEPDDEPKLGERVLT